MTLNVCVIDPHEEDKITAEGTMRFLEDLRLNPENLVVLILAWKFKAATQCEFTREEFVQGMTELGWDFITSYWWVHGLIPLRILKLKLTQPLSNQVHLFKFSSTWSCVSLPRPTTSKWVKITHICLICAQILANVDVQTHVPFLITVISLTNKNELRESLDDFNFMILSWMGPWCCHNQVNLF